MPGRCYTQIRWNKDRFGLMLVNAKRDHFFLMAEKLQDLYDHQDEYRVVKLRDRRPNKASGYYPGQVMGTLELTRETATIWLFIGEPHRDIEFDEDVDGSTPDLYHVRQKYTLPRKEFDIYKKAIDLMMEQEQEFIGQYNTAVMTPLKTYRKKRG